MVINSVLVIANCKNGLFLSKVKLPRIRYNGFRESYIPMGFCIRNYILLRRHFVSKHRDWATLGLFVILKSHSNFIIKIAALLLSRLATERLECWWILERGSFFFFHRNGLISKLIRDAVSPLKWFNVYIINRWRASLCVSLYRIIVSAGLG